MYNEEPKLHARRLIKIKGYTMKTWSTGVLKVAKEWSVHLNGTVWWGIMIMCCWRVKTYMHHVRVVHVSSHQIKVTFVDWEDHIFLLVCVHTQFLIILPHIFLRWECPILQGPRSFFPLIDLYLKLYITGEYLVKMHVMDILF